MKNPPDIKSVYSELSDRPNAPAQIDDLFDINGKKVYEAFWRAKGVHDECSWTKLPWAEKQAWCAAARAIA